MCQRALSLSLQMAPNWGDHSICSRAALPFRGALASWRKGLSGMSYKIQQGQMLSPAHREEQPLATKRVGTAWLESCFAEKDQRVLAESELSMSQQSALATEKLNSVPGCIKSSIAKKLRKVIVHPLWQLTGVCPAPWVQF